MIHLEGMGVLGSLTALRLHAAGVPFTWHDDQRRHVAWPASTGLIYPAGDEWSQRNLARWVRWADQDWLPAGVVERASYVYAHQNPPHHGDYKTTPVGRLTLADADAFTVNAAALVESTRARFARQRLGGKVPGSRLVVAHGFARATSLMWGWSTKVKLRLSPELAALPNRPALYGRKVRQLTYAYPVPGEPDVWWAGSSLVRQTTVRELDADKHFRRWCGDVGDVYRGQVAVLDQAGPVMQGWRPRPGTDVAAPLPDLLPSGTVVYPALWHSGVRWAPLVIERALRLITEGGADRDPQPAPAVPDR